MKLLRTIRLDPSDTFVFTRAAEPGEWAVSGAFLFWDRPADTLVGKERAALRSGLLGIASFGWSTLAVVVEAERAERDAAIETLAERLVRLCGAPDLSAARAAAAQEIDFSTSLAEPAVGTLVAVHRSIEDGDIRERFRTLLPGADERHPRAFSFMEVAEDEVDEQVDLLTLGSAR